MFIDMTRDDVQAAAWAVAALAGLFGMWRAVVELRHSTKQRDLDLRWRQAEMGKKILDELGDSAAHSALTMLDWNGRIYMNAGVPTQPITHAIRRDSLRTVNTIFDPKSDALLIRDAFDVLLDRFERIEHFIRIELIRFEDIRQPLSYYIRKLAHNDERPVIEKFLEEYEFTLARNFLERFKEWHSVQQGKPSA
jgi:hypothetical protein